MSRTVPFRTGYEQALAEAGMPGDERLVVHASSFSMPAGAKAAMQLLQQDDPPTAIMCADDTLAFGVISAVRELGLRVPDDLAVMGYCDLPFASRRYAARHRGDSSRPTRLRGGPNPPQGDRRG
ncbi:MAG: substrate-binding domain-containing protein [Acidimicrobiia bacterium]|nr:substrate-binding domain-containing protein [Acidimicrobiia bacterium]